MKKFTTLSMSTLSIALVLGMSGCGESQVITKEMLAKGAQTEPHKVNRANWVGVDALANSTLGDLQVTSDVSKVAFKISNAAVGTHIQFFIDTDNTKASGYTSGTWSDAGSDYLIEDGVLYRSNINGSAWSWEYVKKVSYTKTATSVEVEMDKSLLSNLGSTIKVGVMSRTASWQVDKLLPSSAHMATYTISDVVNPSEDTVAPVLQLLGTREVRLNVGSVYSELGASAQDNVDGDITNNIQINGAVNTNVTGRYDIVYSVSDAAGNTATQTRTVRVVSSDVEIPEGDIVIDGNTAEWANIPALFNQNAQLMKVTDDNDNFYVMLSGNMGAHTQLFIDTDSAQNTGFTTGSLGNAGADFMVEDGYLYKSTSNSSAWNWEYVSPLTYVKTNNALEMKIEKNFLGNVSESIKVASFSRSNNWSIIAQSPTTGMLTYQTGAITPPPVEVNTKPLANNHTMTTLEDTSAIVVLTGSDADGDALTYTLATQPINGTLTGIAPNLTYVPTAGYFGSDSFTFVVNDGTEDSTQATVSITVSEVTPKNNRSVPTSQSVTTDESVAVSVVLESSDVDGDVLTYRIVQAPNNGTIEGVAPNVTYVPNAEFTGVDTFTFVSNDGIEDSEEATITITVNAVAPVFEGPFAEIKTLIQGAKDGVVNNVSYISVGDSTRANDNYYNGGNLFTAVSQALNLDNVSSSLEAVAGHTLRKWNDFDANRTINEPTWESTVEVIPADGSTAIVNISLGINDARYYGDGGEVERLKFHMGQAIDKVLLAKPNTLIMLTMPHLLVGLDSKTVAIKTAYEEMAVERGLPLVNTMNDLPTLSNDLTNYRAEDATEYGENIRIHLSTQGQTLVSDLILSKILP